jgi:hypothetical protein
MVWNVQAGSKMSTGGLPCGQPPLKWLYGCFRGSCPQGVEGQGMACPSATLRSPWPPLAIFPGKDKRLLNYHTNFNLELILAPTAACWEFKRDFIVSFFDPLMDPRLLMLFSMVLIFASLLSSVAVLVATLVDSRIFCSTCCVFPSHWNWKGSAGKCHGLADHVKNYYYLLIVTKNSKYVPRMGNPWAADRPAGGWPPKRHIVITP